MMNLIMIAWWYGGAGLVTLGFAVILMQVYFYVRYGRKSTEKALEELYGTDGEVSLKNICLYFIAWPIILPLRASTVHAEVEEYIRKNFPEDRAR